ncbi:MAG: aldo/keto reductase [Fimbriimonadaceae bacterium]
MELRQFGKTDMRVSVLGFGGSEIGFEGIEQSKVNQLLNSALDGGLNVIDTGECYKDSEEKIGAAVGHRRNDYFLFTKMGHGFPGSSDPDWSPKLLRESIDHSLKALRTDRLDLLQLHTCSLEALQEGTVVGILQEARAAGKTRFIGYSGDREEAEWVAESGLFDSLQTSINIADQQVLESTLPKARDAGIGVIAKRPIANVAWRSGAEPPSESYHRAYWDRLQKLQYPFLGRSAEDAVGFALRFTLGLPGVCCAIVGSGKPERFAQNAAAAAHGPLPVAEVAATLQRWKDIAEPDWVGQQ